MGRYAERLAERVREMPGAHRQRCRNRAERQVLAQVTVDVVGGAAHLVVRQDRWRTGAEPHRRRVVTQQVDHELGRQRFRTEPAAKGVYSRFAEQAQREILDPRVPGAEIVEELDLRRAVDAQVADDARDQLRREAHLHELGDLAMLQLLGLADFWDLKKYPGKRGLRRSAKYTLEIALLADGVAPADVYKLLATEEGVNRAFKKLDQIKGDTIWWQAAADPALYLADGFFVMTSAYTLWIDREQQRRKNFRIAWNGSLYDVDSWAIPKGTPKVSDAYQFIAFASKPENQKVLSEQLAYGPTNTKALPLFAPDLVGTLPSAVANLKSALKVDTAFWVRHGEALEKRFDAWAPQICVQQTDEDEEAVDYKGHAVCQDKRGNLHRVLANPQPSEGAPHAHHGNSHAH